MIKRMIAALAVTLLLPLAACTTSGDITSPGAGPPPIVDTLVDDKGLAIMISSAETIATSVDALIAAKAIVPGTPRALRVKAGLTNLRTALAAAGAAQKVLNSRSYAEALINASTALAEVQRAIRGD